MQVNRQDRGSKLTFFDLVVSCTLLECSFSLLEVRPMSFSSDQTTQDDPSSDDSNENRTNFGVVGSSLRSFDVCSGGSFDLCGCGGDHVTELVEETGEYSSESDWRNLGEIDRDNYKSLRNLSAHAAYALRGFRQAYLPRPLAHPFACRKHQQRVLRTSSGGTREG